MLSRRAVVPAVLLALAACSSSRGSAVRPATSGTPSRVAAASPSPSRPPLRVGRLSPPQVRLFAGTQSVAGTAVRYCVRGQCVQRRSQPARLPADAGSVGAFAVGRPPERAVVEISGGAGPALLAPATLMALPGRLAPGVHLFTLTLSWADADGTWLFEVVAG